jgi:hypothetical protein
VQVVHVFEQPRKHLVDFERLCANLRQVFQTASAACGMSTTYMAASSRFCERFSRELSQEDTRLQCVGLYSRLVDGFQAGEHYAVLQEVDSYLGE